jgi:hypothetical protein
MNVLPATTHPGVKQTPSSVNSRNKCKYHTYNKSLKRMVTRKPRNIFFLCFSIYIKPFWRVRTCHMTACWSRTVTSHHICRPYVTTLPVVMLFSMYKLGLELLSLYLIWLLFIGNFINFSSDILGVFNRKLCVFKLEIL